MDEHSLEQFDDLNTAGLIADVAANSAIAAVGPGPGPGNSAIAAVGPGPGGSRGSAASRLLSGDAFVSWSDVVARD